MDKIKRFIECLIPVTACNLKCSYCYVIQRDNRKGEMANLKYPPHIIGEALSQKRFGGICYFSICGAGETTLQKDIEKIVYNILKQGHYVNITTNGTITKQIEKILELSSEYTTRLHFSFSLHYLELLRLRKLDVFFQNIELVRRAGASFIVQLNMCDEYIPYIQEIKDICLERVGAYPQVAATRKEEDDLKKIELLTNYSIDEYKGVGKTFESPLFDFTMKNFNVKRKEFCYAGDWTLTLNLSTGIMRRCYSSYVFQDIFKNPKEPVRFVAIGHGCKSPFCMNSSHFMSLGVIPSLETPTYAELRNRDSASWYSSNMNDFLSSKLYQSNAEYNFIKKFESCGFKVIDCAIRVVYKFIKIVRGNP